MELPAIIVATNPYEGEICRRAFAEIGLDVVLAENGEGAVALVNARRPLAVVVGTGLVSIEARALIEALEQAAPGLVVFLVVDASEYSSGELGSGWGATRIFSRPIDPDAISDAVERLAIEVEAAQDSLPLPVPTEILSAGVIVSPFADVAPPSLLRADVMFDPASLGFGEWRDGAPSALPVTSVPAGAANQPIASQGTEPRFDDRSTFARRLDDALSDAERRLFPDLSSTPRPYVHEERDIAEIDLDSIGIDTAVAMGSETEETPLEFAREPSDSEHGPLVSQQTSTGLSPGSTPGLWQDTGSGAADSALALDDRGDLSQLDVAQLVVQLCQAGYTGCVEMEQAGGEKRIYFDAGVIVFARSTFVHDQLGELLYREGKITRGEHARTRALKLSPGRRTASLFVELGLIKASELYPILRHHVEEIVFSCFSWDMGKYRLTPEQPPAEDKLRLSADAWLLVTEGIRRKYGLDRLVDLVGPLDTLVEPTSRIERALAHCALTPSEETAVDLIDGVRTIDDVRRACVGMPVEPPTEGQLYALVWALICLGALKKVGQVGQVGRIADTSTFVRSEEESADRRTRARAEGQQASDLEVERQRLHAKMSQIEDADYFTILGVDRGASAHEIDRAYSALKSDFAPEKFAEPIRFEFAAAIDEIQEVLSEAHRVLRDPEVGPSYRQNWEG